LWFAVVFAISMVCCICCVCGFGRWRPRRWLEGGGLRHTLGFDVPGKSRNTPACWAAGKEREQLTARMSEVRMSGIELHGAATG
jgi:hypothetical protein